AGGEQPMHYADRYSIVFNGEIYNYVELRDELLRTGAKLETRSDTEVILALYARHGRRCVEQLRGMFAFALWDREAQELFLARDRLGKKPLYYCRTDRFVLFASELKAILAHPEAPRDPDPEAIDRYLALGYVPAPWSAIKGIRKLEPATTMMVG